MPLRPIYYDTETTGISAEKDRIVEIAAFDPVRNRTFEALVNPGRPIPAEASAVHHITDDMVADKPSFAKVGADFVDFCEGEVVLIAHNNDGFDLHFLRNEFARNQLILPDWPYIDTLKWARKYRRDLPRHALQVLREIYGFPANNAHRALDDVIVLHQVFEELIDDLSMETILELMGQAPQTQKTNGEMTMPFGKHKGQPLSEVPKSYVSWLAKDGAFDKEENKELAEGFRKAGLLSSGAEPSLIQ